MRRAVLALAVASVVLLAGCGGTGGDTATAAGTPGGSATPEDGDDGTPSGTVTTPTTTTPPPMPTGGLPRSELSWANESGFDLPALFSAHVDALVERGSYAVRTNRTIDLQESDETGSVVTVVRASLDPRRALRRVEQTTRSRGRVLTAVEADYREVGDGNGTVYTRTGGYGDDEPRYEVDRDPWRRHEAYYRDAATSERFVVLLAFEFEYDGTVRRDGTTLYRLVADSFADRPDRILPNVSRGSATILVGTDGVVRLAEYTVEYSDPARGATVETFTYRVTGLGNVTVEPPDWVDEARANASASLAPPSGVD